MERIERFEIRIMGPRVWPHLAHFAITEHQNDHHAEALQLPGGRCLQVSLANGLIRPCATTCHTCQTTATAPTTCWPEAWWNILINAQIRCNRRSVQSLGPLQNASHAQPCLLGRSRQNGFVEGASPELWSEY